MTTVRGTRIRVATAAAYDVVVGEDALAELPSLLGEPQRVALVHAPQIERLTEQVTTQLSDFEVTQFELPDGEQAKTAEVAVRVWELLGEAGFTRSDAVVTLGGGATTDMGGFIAATWLRGVRVVHVPTTVLAMVDAAVGGKTGMNTAAGKNLVGAFHEPTGVLCDLSVLHTLPAPEIVAGLAEVAKCGFIADPTILDLVEKDPDAARDPHSPVLRELVERAIRVKAHVVADDLRETGGEGRHPGREALNYGHTLAHAIERVTGYAVRHGEAVSIGCCFVAELARRTVGLDPAVVDRHARLLAAVGLPVTHSDWDFEDLLDAMRLDKKSRGSLLRFVVLHDLADPRILAGPEESVLGAAYQAIGAPR